MPKNKRLPYCAYYTFDNYKEYVGSSLKFLLNDNDNEFITIVKDEATLVNCVKIPKIYSPYLSDMIELSKTEYLTCEELKVDYEMLSKLNNDKVIVNSVSEMVKFYEMADMLGISTYTFTIGMSESVFPDGVTIDTSPEDINSDKIYKIMQPVYETYELIRINILKVDRDDNDMQIIKNIILDKYPKLISKVSDFELEYTIMFHISDELVEELILFKNIGHDEILVQVCVLAGKNDKVLSIIKNNDECMKEVMYKFGECYYNGSN